MPANIEELGGTADNLSGNPAPTNQQASGEDNTGQELDPAQFWTGTGEEAGTGESDPTPEEFGKGIATEIASYQGVEVFTPEIAQQVAEGNLAGVNKVLVDMQRRTIQQTLMLATQIMRRGMSDVESRFDGRVQSHLGSEKNQATLLEEFPSMREAAMAPVIQGVFNQAMIHSKNDRSKAIKMTRDMLRAMGKSGGQDLGVSDPPSNPDNQGSSRSLVESLLADM